LKKMNMTIIKSTVVYIRNTGNKGGIGIASRLIETNVTSTIVSQVWRSGFASACRLQALIFMRLFMLVKNTCLVMEVTAAGNDVAARKRSRLSHKFGAGRKRNTLPDSLTPLIIDAVAPHLKIFFIKSYTRWSLCLS